MKKHSGSVGMTMNTGLVMLIHLSFLYVQPVYNPTKIKNTQISLINKLQM
ncbi:hypothetical protein Hanom_Chr16g01488451 [Helianthus anomalus]